MNKEEIKEAEDIAKIMYDDVKRKAKLLAELKDSGRVMDELDIQSADMTVTLLHLGKLIEGKFIEMDNPPSFTVDGFDLAMDLIDAGWMINEYEALAICASLFESMDEHAHHDITLLVCEMQNKGINGMDEIMEEVRKDPETSKTIKIDAKITKQ